MADENADPQGSDLEPREPTVADVRNLCRELNPAEEASLFHKRQSGSANASRATDMLCFTVYNRRNNISRFPPKKIFWPLS